jgi:hypothetical protein
MQQTQTINPGTLDLLKQLSALPTLHEMRLVGGTALALQYGHRQSIDLDFFCCFTANHKDLIDQTYDIIKVVKTPILCFFKIASLRNTLHHKMRRG